MTPSSPLLRAFDSSTQYPELLFFGIQIPPGPESTILVRSNLPVISGIPGAMSFIVLLFLLAALLVSLVLNHMGFTLLVSIALTLCVVLVAMKAFSAEV